MARLNAQAILAAFLAVIFLQGSSCGPVERPYPAPSAADVVAVVQRRAAAVRTIRAETRMAHRSEQGRIKGTVRLMAARGGKLRFDAVTPFDTPLATLVSDGTEFSLVDAQQNRHFHGPASPCNIARLIQLVMDADQVLTILGGGTPVIAHRQATLGWDPREGLEVLTLSGTGGLTQVIQLDGRSRAWDLVSSEIRRGSQVLLSVQAKSFRAVAGIRVPRVLEVSQPATGALLDVEIKRVEINIALPEAAFVRPGPGGLPSQRVECDTVIVPKDGA